MTMDVCPLAANSTLQSSDSPTAPLTARSRKSLSHSNRPAYPFEQRPCYALASARTLLLYHRTAAKRTPILFPTSQSASNASGLLTSTAFSSPARGTLESATNLPLPSGDKSMALIPRTLLQLHSANLTPGCASRRSSEDTLGSSAKLPSPFNHTWTICHKLSNHVDVSSPAAAAIPLKPAKSKLALLPIAFALPPISARLQALSLIRKPRSHPLEAHRALPFFLRRKFSAFPGATAPCSAAHRIFSGPKASFPLPSFPRPPGRSTSLGSHAALVPLSLPFRSRGGAAFSLAATSAPAACSSLLSNRPPLVPAWAVASPSGGSGGELGNILRHLAALSPPVAPAKGTAVAAVTALTTLSSGTWLRPFPLWLYPWLEIPSNSSAVGGSNKQPGSGSGSGYQSKALAAFQIFRWMAAASNCSNYLSKVPSALLGDTRARPLASPMSSGSNRALNNGSLDPAQVHHFCNSSLLSLVQGAAAAAVTRGSELALLWWNASFPASSVGGSRPGLGLIPGLARTFDAARKQSSLLKASSLSKAASSRVAVWKALSLRVSLRSQVLNRSSSHGSRPRSRLPGSDLGSSAARSQPFKALRSLRDAGGAVVGRALFACNRLSNASGDLLWYAGSSAVVGRALDVYSNHRWNLTGSTSAGFHRSMRTFAANFSPSNLRRLNLSAVMHAPSLGISGFSSNDHHRLLSLVSSAVSNGSRVRAAREALVVAINRRLNQSNASRRLSAALGMAKASSRQAIALVQHSPLAIAASGSMRKASAGALLALSAASARFQRFMEPLPVDHGADTTAPETEPMDGISRRCPATAKPGSSSAPMGAPSLPTPSRPEASPSSSVAEAAQAIAIAPSSSSEGPEQAHPCQQTMEKPPTMATVTYGSPSKFPEPHPELPRTTHPFPVALSPVASAANSGSSTLGASRGAGHGGRQQEAVNKLRGSHPEGALEAADGGKSGGGGYLRPYRPPRSRFRSSATA